MRLLVVALTLAAVAAKTFDGPVVMGDESIMSQKAHGTSATPVQKNLRWGCSEQTADEICNFNRHYAERSGYWERSTKFLQEESGDVTFYDSNTGKPLFHAPKGRSWQSFVRESRAHGWPSFRDEEVNWDYVRVLPDGECVSTAGTHLGHNLPDSSGNRYCIVRQPLSIPQPLACGLATAAHPPPCLALIRNSTARDSPPQNLVSVAGRPQ